MSGAEHSERPLDALRGVVVEVGARGQQRLRGNLDVEHRWLVHVGLRQAVDHRRLHHREERPPVGCAQLRPPLTERRKRGAAASAAASAAATFAGPGSGGSEEADAAAGLHLGRVHGVRVSLGDVAALAVAVEIPRGRTTRFCCRRASVPKAIRCRFAVERGVRASGGGGG